MITVNDLLNLPVAEKFRIVAGSGGLRKTVNNVGILEYEELEDLSSEFYEGDFVLATFFSCKENPKLMESYMEELIHIGVSGIAIKEVFYEEIPLDINKLANEMDIPIFFYQKNIYLEDIIGEMKDLLSLSEYHSRNEEIIIALMEGVLGEEELNKLLREINPNFYKNMMVAYIRSKTLNNSLQLLKLTKQIYFKNYSNCSKTCRELIQYGDGVFLFYTYDESRQMKHQWDDVLLEDLDIDKDNFYIGICVDVNEEFKLQEVLVNAIDASYVCQLWSLSQLEYNDMGIYKQLLPLKDESGLMNHYLNTINCLKDFDKETNSNLLETAVCYIESRGEVVKTGKKMYQHANTIRYRIQKMRQVLDWCMETEDSFYEQLYIDVKIFNYLKLKEK